MNYRRREILFEFYHHANGKAVRVAAIEPITNTEVIVVGDPAAGDVALKRLATQKLEYVLEKKFAEDSTTDRKQNRPEGKNDGDKIDLEA